MMTIGEFARRTGLSVSALRFYDRRGLLVPADVDPSNSYRRYGEDQIEDGALIRDLRRLDMALGDIARVLNLSAAGREQLVAEHLQRLERIVARAHSVARTMGINHPQEKHDMPTTLNTLDLDQALAQVLPAAGTSAEAPHFMGVLIEAKEGSLRFAATDSHRLAVRDLVPSALDTELSAVVPAATLLQWRSSLTVAGDVEINLADRHMSVTGDGLELRGLVIPMTFPDYEPLLDAAAEATTILVDRSRLLAAVEALDAGPAVLVVAAGRLTINQQGDKVDVEALVDGADHSVGINLGYLRHAVSNAVGHELLVEITQPTAPVLFRSADDGTYVSLVMPIKLD